MRRALALTAAVAAISGGGIVATTVEAHAAGNPSCMSRAEFRHIHQGQSVRTVQRIVGSKGRVSMSSPPLVIRQWKVCTNPYGVGTIGFWSGHVQSKSYLG